MKKVMLGFMVLASLVMASVAFAYDVNVSSEVNGVFTKGYKTSAQEGLEVTVKELPSVFGVNIPKELSVNSGVLLSSTDLKKGGDTFMQATIPMTVGYDFQVSKNAILTPFSGFDFILNDTSKVNNTFGEVIGAKLAYTVNSNWSVKAQGGLLFSECNNSLGEKTSGNGGFFGGVVSYKV